MAPHSARPGHRLAPWAEHAAHDQFVGGEVAPRAVDGQAEDTTPHQTGASVRDGFRPIGDAELVSALTLPGVPFPQARAVVRRRATEVARCRTTDQPASSARPSA